MSKHQDAEPSKERFNVREAGKQLFDTDGLNNLK